MKQRLGALLCLALGAVLITTGMSPGGVTVGGSAAFCQVPNDRVGVAVLGCPTGTIAITKNVLPESPVPPSPADGFVVHVTSSDCLDPTESAVDITLNVAPGDTATTDPLFLFTDATQQTACTYTLTEDAVANFTSEFSPASPVEIPLSDNREAPNTISVTLTNTFTAPSSSAAPSTSVAPSSTAIVDSVLPPSSAPATAEPIAATGPREQIRTTVWIGVALCLLGVVLLYAGTVQRRRAQHRA